MFKQRLKELGEVVLCGLALLILVVAVAWISIELHLDKLLDVLREHQILTFQVFATIVFIVVSFKFVNWLFIEPFKEWRKNKNEEKQLKQ